MINLVWTLMSILIILLIAETIWRMVDKYQIKRNLERAKKEIDEELNEILKDIEGQKVEKEEVETL